MRRFSAITVLAVSIAGIGMTALTLPARAGMIYTDRNLFLAALGASSTSPSMDASGSYGSNPFTFTGAAGTGLVSADGVESNGILSVTNSGVSLNGRNDRLKLSSFGGNPNAFGGYFYVTDIDGHFTPGSVTVSFNGVDPSLNNVVTRAGSDPVAFLGYISSSVLTDVTEDTTDQQFVTAGYVTLGLQAVPQFSAVPEPSTFVCAGIAGLMTFGYGLRRRKVAVA